MQLILDKPEIPEHLLEYFKPANQPCGECHVCVIVEVFRLVREVLADDGTLWLNYGDCYASGATGGAPSAKSTLTRHGANGRSPYLDALGTGKPRSTPPGLKPKDLAGMPWRIALALQADGWWLRSDIIWAKPNPMPESVTDRPTKAHEYLFLLSKRPDYFYDAESIKESGSGKNAGNRRYKYDGLAGHETKQGVLRVADVEWNSRNARTVWNIATESFAEAHFATFPRKLVEPCIMAGTSQRGHCPECGKRWVRVVKPTSEYARSLGTRPRKAGYFDSIALGAYLKERRLALDLSAAQVDRMLGTNTAYRDWEGRNYRGEFRQVVPSWDLYSKLKKILELDNRFDEDLERLPGLSEWGTGTTSPISEGRRIVGGKNLSADYETLGWRPACQCGLDPVPDVCLDPFLGSGTVAQVAQNLGRGWIGIDLNGEYSKMQERRTAQAAMAL